MKKHKEIFAVILVCLLITFTAWAAGTIREDRTQWKVVGYQTAYLTSGVTTLAYPSTKQCWSADISIESGPIRYYYDGQTPDSKKGRTFTSGMGMLTLESYDEMIKFKAALDSTGSGVTIYVTYYGG
jgi:hypothetical protein